jgi:antibiotic biosynthesis monooxygenase (ABM) superfamily enzyme
MPPIHVAIRRRVLPGKEAEFEAAVLAFFQDSMFFPGVLGAQVLRPGEDASSLDYGILRTFDSEASRDAFYASDLFQTWNREVAPMVTAVEYERRDLHGLEAFFRGDHAPPPRWKMAIVTWLGVYPCVLLWSTVLSPALGGTPRILSTAFVTIAVVITLAWGVMPVLTKLLRPWLRSM